MNDVSFKNLDFGTKPSTVSMETVEVTINPEIMIGDYAKAIINELNRRNPIRFKSTIIDGKSLDEELLDYYIKGLLQIRIESLTGTSINWRKAKQLAIPVFIQFVLSQVGIVIDHARGLKFQPTLHIEYDIDKLLSISNALEFFMDDGVTMLKDAFPRTPEGDFDVMSMVIVNDYVMGQKDDHHPLSSYVSAFLGLKLKEETAYRMLYRVRYDDVSFITEMLMHERSIF